MSQFEYLEEGAVLNTCIHKDAPMPGPFSHCHAQYELLFVYAGQVSLESASEEITLEAPFIAIHRPYSFHSLTVLEGSEYARYIFYFSPDSLEEVSGCMPVLTRLCSRNMTLYRIGKEQLQRWLQVFSLFAACDDPVSQKLMVAYILHNTGKLQSIYLSRRAGNVKSYITDVMNYISAHLSEPLTIDRLTEVFFVSRAKLTRDFQQITRSSIYQFILNLRLERSCEMLRSGHAVKDAALACGFSSSSCFIRAFSRHYGIPPLRYAQELKARI